MTIRRISSVYRADEFVTKFLEDAEAARSEPWDKLPPGFVRRFMVLAVTESGLAVKGRRQRTRLRQALTDLDISVQKPDDMVRTGQQIMDILRDVGLIKLPQRPVKSKLSPELLDRHRASGRSLRVRFADEWAGRDINIDVIVERRSLSVDFPVWVARVVGEESRAELSLTVGMVRRQVWVIEFVS